MDAWGAYGTHFSRKVGNLNELFVIFPALVLSGRLFGTLFQYFGWVCGSCGAQRRGGRQASRAFVSIFFTHSARPATSAEVRRIKRAAPRPPTHVGKEGKL